MKKINKLLVLSLFLVILIVLCKKILVFKSINYSFIIDGQKVKIKEEYNNDNYYVEINTNKNIYPFRIYDNLNKKRKIVKNIYLYEDKSIECVLPIINSNLYSDVICYKDGIIYDYHTIKGDNPKLDEFVSNISIYDISIFKNKFDNFDSIGMIKYNTSFKSKNIVALTTYKGLIINNSEVNLFEKDIYDNKISAFINKYYIVADYDGNFSFNYFYIVNLETKEVTKLKSKEDISYDSYIQGIVDNKLYLYDRDNQNQYEIDIVQNKINTVSNENHIKYYNNKKWEKLVKSKANKEVYFNYDTLDNNFSSYDYVKETSNNYYLFKKDGIYYKLYSVDKKNINIYKFIIDVPITNIFFNKNYLYYIYKDKLYYYSDNMGFKTILEDSELEFNDTIKYYVY